MATFLKLRATEFEYRHQTLVRQLIVAIAFSTYFFDRDDVVWRFIRDNPASRLLEHLCFSAATLLIAFAAGLCTRARATRKPAEPGASASPRGPFPFVRYPQQLGDLLFAIGIASLAPLWGAVLLVFGEAVRLLRLIRRQSEDARIPEVVGSNTSPSQRELQSFNASAAQSVKPAPGWGHAFRREAARWGILLTMVVFSVTLIDRLAEVLAVVSVLIAALLNLDSFKNNAE